MRNGNSLLLLLLQVSPNGVKYVKGCAVVNIGHAQLENLLLLLLLTFLSASFLFNKINGNFLCRFLLFDLLDYLGLFFLNFLVKILKQILIENLFVFKPLVFILFSCRSKQETNLGNPQLTLSLLY